MLSIICLCATPNMSKSIIIYVDIFIEHTFSGIPHKHQHKLSRKVDVFLQWLFRKCTLQSPKNNIQQK